jgi:hypothetical protein
VGGAGGSGVKGLLGGGVPPVWAAAIGALARSAMRAAATASARTGLGYLAGAPPFDGDPDAGGLTPPVLLLKRPLPPPPPLPWPWVPPVVPPVAPPVPPVEGVDGAAVPPPGVVPPVAVPVEFDFLCLRGAGAAGALVIGGACGWIVWVLPLGLLPPPPPLAAIAITTTRKRTKPPTATSRRRR